jgi:hypothetical protein
MIDITSELEFLIGDHMDETGFIDEHAAAQELITLICDAATRLGMDTPSYERLLKYLLTSCTDAIQLHRKVLA